MQVLADYSYREQDLVHYPFIELMQFAMKALKLPENSEVSLTFVTNEEIANLNKDFRGIDSPTDVLSFECDNLEDGFGFCSDENGAVFDEGSDNSLAAENDIYVLGDIVIAPDIVEAQCKTYDTTLESETSLLLVHGLLHLCGFDHETDSRARIMEQRERELLHAWADAGHEVVRHVRDAE